MSQNFDTEELVQELVALDSGFKAHEADFRVLLGELKAKRPVVTVDRAFAASLRARILLRERPAPSPFGILSALAFRLAPIGVLALLLLILSPEGLFTKTHMLDKEAVLEEIRENPQVLRVETGGAPSPVSFGMGGGEGIDSSMSMKSMATPADSFTVDSQTPGNTVEVTSVSLIAPGFFVVHEADNNNYERSGELIGVSNLVPEGMSDSIIITLTKPTQQSPWVRYEVMLYRDNGDGVFSPELDTVVTDPPTVTPDNPDTFPLKRFFEAVVE